MTVENYTGSMIVKLRFALLRAPTFLDCELVSAAPPRSGCLPAPLTYTAVRLKGMSALGVPTVEGGAATAINQPMHAVRGRVADSLRLDCSRWVYFSKRRLLESFSFRLDQFQLKRSRM
ncbi:hypothetical protein AB4Y42_20595 [Paraburkholderia sp. EG286B]|uniref:hypothetical protein n=1 Tax=Paraburkholderia sp. EG286B TaxID=3237011 RepID=UPI0034D21E56